MRALVTLAVLLIARSATAGPDVLVQVPSDAVSFVGIDVAAARGSMALTAAIARFVRSTGRAELSGARSLVIAGVPGAHAMHVVERKTTLSTLAFGALWLDAGAKRRAAQILPDLGKVQWVAGTLARSSSGFTLSGSAAMTDPYVAASIAVAIGMGRKLVASQLAPSIAIAIDKIAVTAMGATIRISATWSEADLAALATL